MLREEYRIVGSLVGCLPRVPRQNAHLGLPEELMPEEVALLLQLDVATLVQCAYKSPSAEDIAAHLEKKTDSYEQQKVLFMKEKREEMKRKLPEIIEGKKKKRRKLLEEKRKQGHHVDDAEFEADVEVDPDTVDIPEIREKHMLIEQPLAALSDRLKCEEVELSFPNTPEQILRFEVFKDLWHSGHFLTSGTKFGGDFLVYPGDPSRFHALFVAVCVPHEKRMSALDLIAMGRLGKTVKKTLVLCSMDNNGQLCYNSLQWTGIH